MGNRQKCRCVFGYILREFSEPKSFYSLFWTGFSLFFLVFGSHFLYSVYSVFPRNKAESVFGPIARFGSLQIAVYSLFLYSFIPEKK